MSQKLNTLATNLGYGAMIAGYVLSGPFSFISSLKLYGKYYDLDKGKICNLKNNLGFVKHLEYLLREYI